MMPTARSGLGARPLGRLGTKGHGRPGLLRHVAVRRADPPARKVHRLLEITGPPGSGKSTLVEFLWKLLGAQHEGFDPNKATVVFLARS
jgi:predicted ATPase